MFGGLGLWGKVEGRWVAINQIYAARKLLMTSRKKGRISIEQILLFHYYLQKMSFLFWFYIVQNKNGKYSKKSLIEIIKNDKLFIVQLLQIFGY